MLAALALPGAASAADIELDNQPPALAAPGPERWQFTIAPYVWAAGASGDLSYGGIPLVHVEAPFSHLLDNLNFGGMLVGEARYDRFVLFSDLIDLNVSSDYSLQPMGVAVGLDVGLNLFEWTPMVGYSVVKTKDWNFDVMAGARLWSVDVDTSVNFGNILNLDADAHETWADAMVGVKSQYALTDKLFVAGWAMAGAGGSTFTWDLMGSVGYKFSDRIWGMAGYRAQGVDFDSGSFNIDTTMQGPIIGATFKF
ncbi:hypothetical protein OSH11_13515 [Kaistia dalseonensis]|uniref:Outer membrane protein beta-barrel domain-containing protein n=1 Tax=Kaistia dalseonensis TaxID=410840 RepID=A0ABU0H7P2_9HYPH|nr:hypothetical protein [Kaistia dalseonensis]MCX5495727.1 hypothetical protein [Kaistia dalseonensis]MDQ0438324.1 hypothetical protein [Kaistia dalseonensis]